MFVYTPWDSHCIAENLKTSGMDKEEEEVERRDEVGKSENQNRDMVFIKAGCVLKWKPEYESGFSSGLWIEVKNQKPEMVFDFQVVRGL